MFSTRIYTCCAVAVDVHLFTLQEHYNIIIPLNVMPCCDSKLCQCHAHIFKILYAFWWIHLPFRGHWPYRLRSNNGSCSRTNDWQLSIYPRRRIPAFVPHGIKANLCVLFESGIECRNFDAIVVLFGLHNWSLIWRHKTYFILLCFVKDLSK